ncbi:GumC domain-containing protein [Levilactobacillus fujinensis]|uniref:Uncharacterized protein n=1 Tax=Levilactobacillus fujinensis TaxID=2486024 RepID=A0ABW1TJ49_9LACO|nr:hypothetical protein [Levilactobacillus fujinensis]
MVNQQFNFKKQSQQDKQRAHAVKLDLLERYQQREQQFQPTIQIQPEDQSDATVALKSEVRHLRHQLQKEQANNRALALREKLRTTQQSQQQLKKANRRLTQQNQALSQENTDITQQNQRLQIAAATSQRQLNYVQTYLIQAGNLLHTAETRLQTIQQLRQQPHLQPLSHKQRKKLAQLPAEKARANAAEKHQHVLKNKVASLNQDLTASRETIRELNRQIDFLRNESPQNLKYHLDALLNAKDFQQIRWLPDFAKRYRQLRLNELVIRQENQTYGYFIKVNTHVAFKTIDDQIFSNYDLDYGSEPRLDVIYAGILTGNKGVLLTQMYREVTPHDLTRDKLRRLHQHTQRAHPMHFTSWLPVDGKAILNGKRILIVTWQQTQTLNQAFHSFGASPTIVNNHEKSISWITQQAIGQQTDLTFLMSEGLSHAVLKTLTKGEINSRPDIRLVYHQSPADIINQAYQYFKNLERQKKL